MKLLTKSFVLSLCFTAVIILSISGRTVSEERSTIISPEYQQVRAEISKVIEKEMAKNKVMGLSIALVDDQKIGWAEGFGYADKAKNLRATPESVYMVGCISKIFTATAIMQLTEQGKLNIESPLVKYLPEFQIKSRYGSPNLVTLKNILTHHSGLPGDYLRGMWAAKNPLSTKEIVKLLKDDYLAFPPNLVWSYSNLGYGLLGNVMEKVVKEDFVTYMDKALFLPMKMLKTSYALRLDLLPYLAKPYREGKEEPYYDASVKPACSLLSSTVDLSTYMKTMFAGGKTPQKQILKPETLWQMWSVQNEDVPLDFDFHMGLGYILGDLYGYKTAEHFGNTINYHSQLILIPELKLGVVVLTNSTTGEAVVGKVATEILRAALEVKTGKKITQPKITDAPVVKTSVEELKKYEGYYQTEGGLVEIRAKNDGLVLNYAGMPIKLLPNKNGRFYTRLDFLGLFTVSLKQLSGVELYVKQVNGRDVLLAYQEGKVTLMGEKVQTAPVPKIWLTRLGVYEPFNLVDSEFPMFDTIELTYEDEMLVVTARSAILRDKGLKDGLRLALNPLSGTESIICGLGRNRGDNIKAVPGQEGELLYYSGYLWKRVD